jgi:MerR family transcriptional regulator/heat shock protein HspR
MTNNKEPIYMIGVAARILNIHPQTLRLYERENLVVPQRTGGDTRLYSDFDLDRIREIQHLTQDMGLNLAGVKLIFEMRNKAQDMQDQISKFEKEMNDLQLKMQEEISKVHKSYKHELVLYKQSPLAILKHLKEMEEERRRPRH